MSSTDERLSDLLAERARQGSGVHPTREGVDVALTRRAARRRRKRAVVTGLAGLCLVAGIVGGLALAGDDDGQEDGFTAPTGPLPEVPAVGIAVDGFVLRSSTTGLMELDGEPPITATVFRSGTDLAAPFLTVVIESRGEDQVDESDRGDPVDIDGDGVDEGRITTVNGTTALTWPLADGATAGIAGYHLPETDVLAYGEAIFGAEQPLDELPAPAGLPERSQWTLPSNPAPDQSILTYQGADDASIRITTTNQPGYVDLLQASTSTYDTDAFESVPLGDSFLGPGRAIVSEPAPGHPYALVLTDSGLTIEVSTESSDAATGFDVDDLRTLLADGVFIEVDPVVDPPTTTVVEPQTTTSVAGSASTMVTDVTLEPGDELDRVEVFFSEAVADHELTSATEPFSGDCGPAPTDGEAYLTLRLEVPFHEGQEPWPGIDLVAPEADGKVRSIWSCGWVEGAVHLSIALDAPREPEVYEGLGQPVLIIDVPR